MSLHHWGVIHGNSGDICGAPGTRHWVHGMGSAMGVVSFLRGTC